VTLLPDPATARIFGNPLEVDRMQDFMEELEIDDIEFIETSADLLATSYYVNIQ
jgi:hypothetical protein